MFGFGRLMHLTFDVLLISACLAGIKRSTGLSPALSRIASKDLRQLFVTYLELGEWVMDLSMCVSNPCHVYTSCQFISKVGFTASQWVDRAHSRGGDRSPMAWHWQLRRAERLF
ncbi:BQ2448_4811 [Microbotryum intermedium]|uniref:BQ2448_4811 protein n=1 Tax=Microbotryum intermedium TaxID=269621 RepID=A0A238FFV6_9BASI|nr:BQ2448_4811 [Microbotryum intermedium]